MLDLQLPLWLELWVFVALISAAIRTVQSTLGKWLTGEYTGLDLAWGTTLVGAVCLAPVAAWTVATTAFALSPTVVAIAVAAACVELVGFYAWLEALSAEDLSVVSPLRQTVPIFVVVLEPVLLGVAFDPRIALGGVLAAAGAYVVLVDETGVFAPLKRVSERGPQLALGAALLYAFASITAKFILATVPSVVYAFFIFSSLAIGFSLLLWRRDGTVPYETLARKRVVSLGVVTSLLTASTFVAFTLAPVVSQAVVVFRASIIFNIALGGLLFKETDLTQKFLGALLIIVGIAAAVL